jgi:uncharacterized protein
MSTDAHSDAHLELPREAIGEARAALERFAAASPRRAELAPLIGTSDPRELADLPAQWRRPLVLDDALGLSRLLDSPMRPSVSAVDGEMVIGLDGAGLDLMAFASGLPEDTWKAVDVVVARALSPAQALVETWPDSALFDPAERELLARLPVATEPAVPVARWVPGADMNYRGYVCAIAKFTRLCNLRCAYCHDWRAGRDQKMTFPVIATLMWRLLAEADHAVVDLVWHGGEPTLLGRRTFLRILALQERFRRPGQVIRNIVQTNGLTMDAEWVAFFKRYGFKVGLSLDGPPELHDRSRPDTKGRPTSHRVTAAVRQMSEAGLLHTVLVVVGRNTIALGPRPLLDFFAQAGITRVGFLPVRPGAGDGMATDGNHVGVADYVDYLLAIEAERRRRPDWTLHVRELDAAKSAMAGRSVHFCEVLGNCVGAFFSIEPNGTVAHCDKYVGDKSFDLGHIMTDSFATIRRSMPARRAAEENRQAVSHLSCRYFGFCRGWCPHERYVAALREPDRDPQCCGLSRLFDGLAAAAAAGAGATEARRDD